MYSLIKLTNWKANDIYDIFHIADDIAAGKDTLLMEEKGYKGVFKSLTKEKQSELIKQKVDFAKESGIDL